MDAIIYYIYQWLAWIADRIIEWLMNNIQVYYNLIASLFDKVTQALYEYMAAIYEWLEGIMAGIVSFFDNLLNKIEEVVAGVWDQFLELSEGVIDQIVSFIDNAFSEVSAFVDTLVDEVQGWLTSAGEAILDLINQGIEATVSVAAEVKNTLTGWLDEVIATVLNIYQATLDKLNLAIDAFIGGVGSFIEAIESRLSELKVAFTEAATEVVKGLTGAADEYITPIREKIEAAVDYFAVESDPKQMSEFVGMVGGMAAGEASPKEYQDFFAKEWRKFAPSHGFVADFFFFLMGWVGSIFMLLQIGQLSSQVMMQEFSKAYPYQIFTPADTTLAWRRGILSKEVALDTIQRHGWTKENADIILQLSDQVPAEGDLLVMFHRGLIDNEALKAGLHQRGYDAYYKQRIIEASYLIPPVNDLITMAVREAFSPEIAKRFGQYEDFPEPFKEWAEKQGLTREWAERYWAAHWALPSPLQGFEMLHRGVIGEEDLNLLLRALDVMPFWRDKLTQIAYTPFTRVDIRRMHRLGVLSEDEVFKAYKDIGYNESNAKKMTDFVLLLNAPEAADNEDELKTLSRSNVVNFYSDGLIARGKAVEMLLNLGYTEDAATMYLDSADLDEQRKDRKAEVTLTLSLAEAGVITFEEAEQRLMKVGLETQEVSKALVDLLRRREKKTRLPSRSEAERMVKAGLLKEEDYKDFLEVLGYAEKWVKGYIGLLHAAV